MLKREVKAHGRGVLHIIGPRVPEWVTGKDGPFTEIVSLLAPGHRRPERQVPQRMTHRSVRTLQVTDKQYGRMELLLGTAPKTEEIGASQMVLL